jgi:hypothetical protein
MIRRTLALALLAALPMPAAAQQQAEREPGTTGLTIYNDGRVLVRRALPATVARGRSDHSVTLGRLDPGSLVALDSNVWIVGIRYDGAVDEESALRRSVGERLVFLVQRPGAAPDTVSAVVLGTDPLRLGMPGGRVAYSMPGLPLYPADVAAQGPSATLTVESRTAQDSLRLGYFTNGATWYATYDAVLAGRDGRVTGKAVIDSRTLGATGASVQLVAGDVNRATRDKNVQYAPEMMVRAQANDAMETAQQERVGEFHLYTIPGDVTIRPGQSTARALFEPARVDWERKYVVPGQLPYWGPLQRMGDEEVVPVEVRYIVKRPRDSDFGGRPIPAGVARVYQPDSAGRLQLVGEASVTHTPAGQDLELTAGTAFDVTARRVQTSYDMQQEPIGGGATRTVVTAEYEVTLTNATDSAVTVTVVEERHGDWEITSSTVPSRRVSSTRAEFVVEVPAEGSRALRYRIRATW